MNEKADAEGLKEKTIKRKLLAFNTCRHFIRMKSDELSHAGHKTIPDALLYTIKSALKDIEEYNIEYFKKYPDWD